MNNNQTHSTIPAYLRASCKAMQGAQFAFISNAVVWCAQIAAAADEGAAPPKAADLARAIVLEYPALSVKTIGNYLGTALALAAAHRDLIRAHLAACSDDWPATAARYVKGLQTGLKSGGYTQSEPDLRAYATGAPSAAKAAAAKAEQQARNAAAAAEAAKAVTIGATADKPAEQPEQPAEQPAPKEEPAPSAERETMAADKPAEQPAAKPAEQPAETMILSFIRRPDGSVYMVENGAARAELIHAGLLIQAALESTMPTEPRTLTGVTGELIAA